MISESTKLENHHKVWQQAQDYFLCHIMDLYLNEIPNTSFETISDSDFEKIIKNDELFVKKKTVPMKNVFDIACEPIKKATVIHFPISTANCGTLDGNLLVLEEFCKILGVTSIMEHNERQLSYNISSSSYDLKKVYIFHVDCSLTINR